MADCLKCGREQASSLAHADPFQCHAHLGVDSRCVFSVFQSPSTRRLLETVQAIVDGDPPGSRAHRDSIRFGDALTLLERALPNGVRLVAAALVQDAESVAAWRADVGRSIRGEERLAMIKYLQEMRPHFTTGTPTSPCMRVEWYGVLEAIEAIRTRHTLDVMKKDDE